MELNSLEWNMLDIVGWEKWNGTQRDGMGWDGMKLTISCNMRINELSMSRRNK